MLSLVLQMLIMVYAFLLVKDLMLYLRLPLSRDPAQCSVVSFGSEHGSFQLSMAIMYLELDIDSKTNVIHKNCLQ